ncbi:MAG: rhomboid family intramembrane serine protease [Chlorobi bacterium]|nr:rhomboid family intramembrane serine protease [Chlorobiota bacterium]
MNNSSFLGNIPPVTKNILIINVLVFFATSVFQSFGIDINNLAGLHFFLADSFNPAQLVTYMFLHANITHIFFNMFAVYMFGRVLEQVWGPKRFLIYYMVTGIGAAVIQQLVQYIELKPVLDMMSSGTLSPDDMYKAKMFLNAHLTIGASGAVFGILLAFGMLFPDTILMLLFPPIPIKAKYFVMIYGAIELFMGIKSYAGAGGDNIAHWAHIGGMIFGYFLIRHWKKQGLY